MQWLYSQGKALYEDQRWLKKQQIIKLTSPSEISERWSRFAFKRMMVRVQLMCESNRTLHTDVCHLLV